MTDTAAYPPITVSRTVLEQETPVGDIIRQLIADAERRQWRDYPPTPETKRIARVFDVPVHLLHRPGAPGWARVPDSLATAEEMHYADAGLARGRHLPLADLQDLEWSRPLQLSVAPVDANPLDPSVWQDIGWLTEPPQITWADTEEVQAWQSADTLRTLLEDRTFTVDFPSVPPSWIAPGGIPVYESPHLKTDQMFMFSTEGLGMSVIIPRGESRPFTDLERDGEWARRTVRRGLTEAFPWLNEDPGPDPDAAYTDDLWHFSVKAALSGGVW